MFYDRLTLHRKIKSYKLHIRMCRFLDVIFIMVIEVDVGHTVELCITSGSLGST